MRLFVRQQINPMDHLLLKPTLYKRHPAGNIVLLGGKCARGHVFFPFQSFGCERCGSTELQAVDLAGAGRLVASALVHLHADPARPAPFTIGTVALDDGPVVRTLLTEPTPLAGGRVRAVLVPASGASEAALDLRFQAEGVAP